MELEYFLILLSILVIIIHHKEKKKEKVETFVSGNFDICDERDCACLKLNTAPDGTCTKEKIPKIPPIPGYEERVFYNKKALNNIKYPKKRHNEILIFVGDKMKNKSSGFRRDPPEILENSFRKEYRIHSLDDDTMELYEIFERVIDILSYFDNNTKPYLKYLILNTSNVSKDRKVMKSFGIDYKRSPAIYLYNEHSKDLKRFLLKKNVLEKQCDMLERLLVFISNGDCGLLSYLNYLHDPFYGMKFEYNSEKKKWRANLSQGRHPILPGTGMCSLIDIQHVPEEYKCDKLQL